MRNHPRKTDGFSLVETIIVIVIIAVIVAAGWWIYDRNHKKATPTASKSSSLSQSPTASDVSSAPAVNSASDLDKALQTLNQNDPSSANTSDSSQLSSQTSAF